MLREVPSVRQIPGEHFRRWFVDDQFDLFVWEKPDGSLHGFQLCYGKEGPSHALTWLESQGFFHDAVDWGEEDPLANRTPMLTPGAPFNAERVFPLYLAADANLPEAIRYFIREKIEAYGQKS